MPDRFLRKLHSGLLGFGLAGACGMASCQGAPALTLQGPGVRPSDFRVTVFARNVDFPLGMVSLDDGSLLVAETKGTSFWNGNAGQLVRYVDANQDGVADGAGTVLYSGLPSGLTSLRKRGSLFFVTGQGTGHPIWVLRAGATPDAPLSLVGSLSVRYPTGGWEHPHSGLAVRPVAGKPGSCDLLFQLGSDQNFARTTRTAALGNSQILGATGNLRGESIYLVTLTDHGTNVTAAAPRQLAKGLRNAAGFIFHPVTGDLYFNDNGIDGLVDANEPLSADELNVIPAAQIGIATIPDFGFPDNYTEYRTGRVVGGNGVQPVFAFQPLPNPLTGSESEGPNEIAFAPPGFPPGLNNGVFLGFHGKWALAGIPNEENPLVFADLGTGKYFQFIGNGETAVGHFDGLLSTDDSLFLSDLTGTGATENSQSAGVIYQIKSLVAHRLNYEVAQKAIHFQWSRGGVLQHGPTTTGPWSTLVSGTNDWTLPMDAATTKAFYRIQF
jgi:glucose/arabinose dehydrogenase